jgi:hypothetical protein
MYNRGRYGSIGYNSVFRSVYIPVIGEVIPHEDGGVFGKHRKRVPVVRFRRHAIDVDGRRRRHKIMRYDLNGRLKFIEAAKYKVNATRRISEQSTYGVEAGNRFPMITSSYDVESSIGHYVNGDIEVSGIRRINSQSGRLMLGSTKFGLYGKRLETIASTRHQAKAKKIVTGKRDITPLLVACGLIEGESDD